MDDLDRRALLGVAGVASLAALASAAKAGPINPPVGPVASTGRTNTEIYNKIPAVGGADGRTPIPGGTTPVTISQAGSFVLTGNITVGSGVALTIAASGVTLDLNGYRITQTSTPVALRVNSGLSDVIVRNGSIVGGFSGIDSGTNCIGLVYEDLAVYNAKFNGIGLESGGRGCVIRRCRVYDIGSTTAASDTGSVLAISNNGALGSRIEDCVVSRVYNNGTGSIFGVAGSGSGCVISGCVVMNDAATTGTGISTSGSVYRNNTVHNFSTSYTGTGTNGGGNF